MQINLTGEAEHLALEAVQRGEAVDVDTYVNGVIVDANHADQSQEYDLTEEQEREVAEALEEAEREGTLDGPTFMRELMAGLNRAG